jgi:glycosyltransferase involved in cell wall biosynthesis
MERAAFELSRHLSQITPVKLIKWGGSNKWLPFVLPWLFFRGLWSLLTNKIQVIYLQDGLLAPLGVVFKLFTGKPVIITLHGRDITYGNPLYQFLIPRCLKRLDRIACVSEAIRQACCKRKVKADKTVVIANGISDDFYLSTDKKKLRNELATKLKQDLGERKILLTVGRFVEKKGIHWFVEEVMPKLADNTFVYVIAGSGLLEPVIRKSIEEHKLQNDIFLLGWANSDMLRLLYNTADIFVMPNIPVEGDMEGFGLVALEAASCGLPVVASNLEGIMEVIRDNENGFLVEPGSPQAFIQNIGSLLTDDEQRRAFGERARQYTLENYGWDRMARRYIEVFEEL